MSLRRSPGEERRRGYVPPSVAPPSRLKTVLDVGNATTGVYPAVVPANSMWTPRPTRTYTDLPMPDNRHPYANTEPTPQPSDMGWSTLRRSNTFRAHVNEELGMGTSVEFTPRMDGTMEAVVTPNTSGGLLDMLGAWFYQSQWHFSGPPGQEMPTKIVLPSGDILYPEFVQKEDGDMYLKSYGYIGKDNDTVAYMERKADGTYKPVEGNANGSEQTKWTEYATFCIQGVLVCISWLLVAIANTPSVQAQVAFGNDELFLTLKRGQEKRKRVLEGPWSPEYGEESRPAE